MLDTFLLQGVIPKECLAFWYANAWPSAGIWFISAQGLSRPEYHTAGPVYLCTISLWKMPGRCIHFVTVNLQKMSLIEYINKWI